MLRKIAVLALSLCFLQAVASDTPVTIGPGLRALQGIEPTQQIGYARIFLDGTMVPAGSPSDASPLSPSTTPPVLIAQCTRDSKGKLRFELMMNFGDVEDIAYYPPWKSTGPDDLYPPATQKTPMTFNFFGYTKVKPVKRSWELSQHVPGEFRYDPPSGGSRNLEEITFYLQYLKALPTLRLTHDAAAAQFETTPWIKAVHENPLCAASGL